MASHGPAPADGYPPWRRVVRETRGGRGAVELGWQPSGNFGRIRPSRVAGGYGRGSCLKAIDGGWLAYHAEQEDEAKWLGGILVVTDEACVAGCRHRSLTLANAAAELGVSEDLMRGGATRGALRCVSVASVRGEELRHLAERRAGRA